MNLWATLMTAKVPTKKHEFTSLALNKDVYTNKAMQNFICNEEASQYYSCWHKRQYNFSSCSNGSPLGLAQAYVLAEYEEAYLMTLNDKKNTSLILVLLCTLL